MISAFPCEATRLSVVIPNFNHGAHVGDAVRAVAQQRPAPDEIIVVDDASTDDSLDVLRRLGAEHETLRVVPLERNGGPILALNRGLAEARGIYVYFGAADDVVRPGLFEVMLNLLGRHPEAAFASGEGLVVDVDTGRSAYRPPVRPVYRPAFLAPRDFVKSLRRIDNWILTGAAVVRRDLIAGAGGFDPTLGAFADSYVLRRLALTHGSCYAPHLGLEWRIRAIGVSRALAGNPETALKTLNLALGRMRADPVFPDWYPDAFERRWRFAVGRVAAETRPMNRTALTQVGARGPIGRTVLAGASRLGGPVGRLAALAWLTLRERPTSLAGLAATWLARSHLRAQERKSRR